jgi:pimeloyl-ACP methyl ester carboxylesterase
MPPNTEPIPTVFLHGFSGEGRGLRAFADLYSGKDALCINLPGFGGTDAPDAYQSDDIYHYAEDVWRTIRQAVPKGRVNLVGHSHGTMVGYTLALRHADEINRLDLFCPVARPRLIPRTSIGAIRLMQSLKVPANVIIRLMAHPRTVALVTRYSFRSDWSDEDRRRITEMRQHESQFYSPVMFDLMRQTLDFTEVMEDTYCQVPTRICYVDDDNVAGDRDHMWYKDHTNTTKIKEVSGGHLCVVACPEKVVAAFGYEESK